MTTDVSNDPSNTPPEFSLQDLSVLKSIIDVASSRGAFKPTEMVAVGQAYTKLSTFLEVAAQVANAAKSTQEEAPQ